MDLFPRLINAGLQIKQKKTTDVNEKHSPMQIILHKAASLFLVDTIKAISTVGEVEARCNNYLEAC